jgi:hypothetical protein
MENNIQIKTSDLKEIMNLLIMKLDHFDDVIIDKDLYWSIPEEKLYNVYEEPNDFTIGSLVEDWTFLQDIILGKREILDYDLYKISILLRYLSSKEKIKRKT